VRHFNHGYRVQGEHDAIALKVKQEFASKDTLKKAPEAASKAKKAA
jgi:hypothetical protein